MRHVAAVLLLCGATGSPTLAQSSELELPASLRALLADGKWDATPTSFRIITLSHLADGCAAQGAAHPLRRAEAVKCVGRALALGRRTMPAASLEGVGDGLWLSHLSLILGASDKVGPCADAGLHEAVSRRLAAMSLAEPTKNAPSYGSSGQRWPADQSVTLAALARFDAAHHGHLLQAPLAAWEAFVVRRVDPTTKLPPSELTNVTRTSRLPRGCAQSFISRYLAEADPALAATWWSRYREGFLLRYGTLVGFREWPPGVDDGADVDSGPVILGIGVSASALGIAAARAQGDELLALQLEASADQVIAMGLTGPLPFFLLSEAIRFEGRWQPQLVPVA